LERAQADTARAQKQLESVEREQKRIVSSKQKVDNDIESKHIASIKA